MFDSTATVAGDYVQISSATAGDCTDAGSTYPTSGQVIGRVLSTHGSGGGTYAVALSGLAAQGGSSGGSGPSAFSFTNQTGEALSTRSPATPSPCRDSPAYWRSVCNTGCTGILRNGTSIGTFGDFLSGDTIAITQTSSGSASTQTTAAVTVGGTTSGTWDVTTANCSSGSTTFSYTGSNQTFTLQSGCSSFTAYLWGAGGGAGGGGIADGGGGGYATAAISNVTGGTSFTIVVGQAGVL